MLGGLSPSSEFFKCEKVAEQPLACFLLRLHLVSKFLLKRLLLRPRPPPGKLRLPQASRLPARTQTFLLERIHLQKQGSFPLSGLGPTSSRWQGQQTSIKLPLFPEPSLPMKSQITPHAKSLCPLPQVHCLPSPPSSEFSDPLSWIITK